MIIQSLYSLNQYHNFKVLSFNSAQCEQIDIRRGTVARTLIVTLDKAGNIAKVTAVRGSKVSRQGSTQCQDILRQMVLDVRAQAENARNTLWADLAKGCESTTALYTVLVFFLAVFAYIASVFFGNPLEIDNIVTLFAPLVFGSILLPLTFEVIAPIAKWVHNKQYNKVLENLF